MLIIHLKRFFFEGPFRSKIGAFVDCPDSVGARDVASNPRCPARPYRLYGVVNHHGDLSGGHYTALCRHPSSSDWRCFNDSTVSQHAGRVCTADGYLFFYTKRNFDRDVRLFD